MIRESDFWMGRDVQYASELTEEIKANAKITIERVNNLLAEIGYGPNIINKITSGWRPRAINSKVSGAAPRSAHLTGRAVDIADGDGKIYQAILSRPELLKKHKLNMEKDTKGWVHLDTRPEIGYRVFAIK